MGLTLKEVYELRKGLISFTNQLFNTKSKFKFQVIPDAWKDFEKSFSFYFKPNVEQDKRKKIKDVFFKNANNCLTKSQKDLGQRIVALDVYAYLVEKYEELKNDNKGQEHNIVIEEFRKNIDIFKSQLLKNNMFEFELIDKLEDKNRNRKEIHTIQKEVKAVESCFKAEIERLIFELVNAKTELEVIDYNLNGIDARNDGLLKSDNFVLFTPEEINQKDKKIL